MRPESFGNLFFPEAARLWLSSRHSIAPQTVRDYQNCIKSLTEFFAALRLSEIHIGHIQEYQNMRKARPTRANKELGVTLSQILARGGLWKDISPYYEPLQVPRSTVGFALEPEEEKHLFLVAARRPRWLVPYCASVLARNTCMGTAEIRQLQLRNVDQGECAWVRIEGRVKNESRIRTLKCNADAAWALRQLLNNAHDKGASEPDHFLIPHRAKNGNAGADPTRPAYSFYTAWNKIRKEAGKKYPRLARVRFYDMRHTANTRLLENPDVPYNAIEHYMGHEINSRTKRLYDHIRDTTLKRASDALSSGHVEEISKLAYLEPKKKPAAVESLLRHRENPANSLKLRQI